ELLELRSHLPGKTPILIGGGAAESYRTAIEEAHAQLLDNFGAFQVALAKIRATRT
ncbi:MAG: hypothetical protein JO170_31175, partial [Verrucomicrobia bacterium]|nr:hypothetical protein [Verrucomicrobiota bacterium]